MVFYSACLAASIILVPESTNTLRPEGWKATRNYRSDIIIFLAFLTVF